MDNHNLYRICAALERIAKVQEDLFKLALESRAEKNSLAEQMKAAFKARQEEN